MTNKWRRASWLLALSILAGTTVLMHQVLRAQTPDRRSPQALAELQSPKADSSLVYDYAGRITRLMLNGKIDELAHLDIPPAADTAQLQGWKSQYVSQIQTQLDQRDKQYADAVSKARDEIKLDHYDMSMASVVGAYRIAKDPDAFLKLDWVKSLTDKVATRAADLEKKGQWLESLELFSELNTLYEIDTRFKADAQRLNRRTRLIAVYTPKVLLEMRKELDAKERENPATSPATAPATEPAIDESSFTRWQDTAEKVSLDMSIDALNRAADDWVERSDYPALLKGGIESLRLFLTTPELAQEFPGLASAPARQKFSDALDAALAAHPADKELNGDDVETVIKNLEQVSSDSIKLPDRVIIMEFTDGAIEQLDPFTAVIWPHELDEFEKNTRGSFGGVGIQISMENGQLKVISPLEDTPAFKAGIEAGDVIIGIDGKTTVGISIDQAVHSIMGEPNSPVTLRIKRMDGSEKDFAIKRDLIKVSSVKGFNRDAKDSSKWNFMIDKDNKIGYIRITGFQEDTADELRSALTTLKNQSMRGVILDLRFNPGGLLNAAVDISDMFLRDGVIVSTKGRTSHARPQEWRADSITQIPMNMPMVVLVNEYSASASEIFSGAMKDLHRALIVGHRTFGKGSVQNLLPIGNERRSSGDPEAMMKLTMAYYYLPNGESLHRRDRATAWGVDPDVAVNLTPDQLADLLKNRRDSDIIHPADASHPATAPSTAPAFVDTQLDAGLLMMRLQLVQSAP